MGVGERMESPSPGQFLLPIYTSEPWPTNSPSTWICLHPNKLVVMLQEPDCMPPLPGGLPGAHPPPPTPSASPSIPSAGLHHPAGPAPAPSCTNPGAQVILHIGRSCPESLWSRRGRAWRPEALAAGRPRGPPASLHLPLPTDHAAADGDTVPAAGAAKAEGAADTAGPRGGP